MNRLFLLSLLLGVICFTASATLSLPKQSRQHSSKSSPTKKLVVGCCVAIVISKTVTYYCVNNDQTYQTELTTSHEYCGENDCTESAIKAYQIASDQMMTAEAAWLASRRLDCDNAPPIE